MAPSSPQEGLLASHGRCLRVGPFPSVPGDPQAGLDAAYEWLHAGARSAAIDVEVTGSSEGSGSGGGGGGGGGGLPLPADCEAFCAALGVCFGKELAARRPRIAARLKLGSDGSIDAQLAALAAACAVLRSAVGTVQVLLPRDVMAAALLEVSWSLSHSVTQSQSLSKTASQPVSKSASQQDSKSASPCVCE